MPLAEASLLSKRTPVLLKDGGCTYFFCISLDKEFQLQRTKLEFSIRIKNAKGPIIIQKKVIYSILSFQSRSNTLLKKKKNFHRLHKIFWNCIIRCLINPTSL